MYEPDQLKIKGMGTEQVVPLAANQLSIGRSPQNDITLPEDSVSGRHARLERGATGWQIVDLHSTNGTTLAGKELTPNQNYDWLAGTELIIGPYHLVWETAVSPPPPPEPPAPTFTRQMDREDMGTSNLGQISLEPLSVTLAPGTAATVDVRAINEAQHVEQYYIEVEGLPDSWVRMTHQSVQEMPTYREVTFHCTIQPSADALAKTYPYRLILRSVADKREEGTAFGNLLVQPAPQFIVALNPRTLKNRGNCQAVIQNRGNTAVTYTITGQDEGHHVIFDQPRQQVTIAPGQEERVQFRVRAANRPWTGRARNTPFVLQVEPDKGRGQPAKGELNITPRLPRRLLILLGLLLGVSFVLPVVRPKMVFSSLEAAIATATADVEEQEQATLAATATIEAVTTLTAEEAIVATGTAVAVATRAWETSDSDGDGLTNAEELEVGTDPDKPDTDNDGLLDGEEIDKNGVPLLGTNPKNPDSDNDELLDGDEVKGNPNSETPARGQFTDPSNRDSDGDNIPDNVDDDSGAWPTPTPTPEVNLLINPSFELGVEPFTERNNAFIKHELNVPSGWHLMVDDNIDNIHSDGSPFVFPEMQPWRADQMSECTEGRYESICDVFVEEHALKVFKGGLPIRFAMFQDVFLPEGVYTFRVHFFADTVAYYEGNQKVWGQPGAAEIQLCIDGGEYNHLDWEPVEIGINSVREVEFIVPTSRTVTIYAKFRNTQDLNNNGWFLDDWTLQPSAELNDEMKGVLSDEHGCRADIPAAYSNR